jgi:MYXO-CTERM domain-containing protein
MWAAADAPSANRIFFTSTLLASGRVLLAGGWVNGPNATAELYDPVANQWMNVPNLALARAHHTATVLPDGRVLVVGGEVPPNQGSTKTVEIFQPSVLGDPCASGADCPSGFCADGVCCDTACNAGACDACSVAAGAPKNGNCASLDGKACDDGDACTKTDACAAFVCVGSNPVICSASDACHDVGACDPGSGACSDPAKADGAPCPDDGDLCTTSDVCITGVCKGTPVVCPPPDACHVEGACNPTDGACSSPVAPDGTACPGGACLAGVCKSGGAGGAGGSGGAEGVGGAGGSSPDKPRDESGCGCRAAGQTPAPWPLALLMIAMGLRRRNIYLRSVRRDIRRFTRI